MDNPVVVIGLAMIFIALVAAIAKQATKKRHATDVLSALKSFRCDPSWREKQFHKALRQHLNESLDQVLHTKTIIDAQIPRTTTEVDLHVMYGTVDYLVTVKKGINAQKVKILAGEVQEIFKYWPKNSERTARVVVMLFGELEAEAGDDHVGKVIELTKATAAGRDDMHLEFVFTDALATGRKKMRSRSA